MLALEVLEHLEDPAAAVAEMRRVSSRAVALTVPLEPFFRGGNLARGRYVERLGSTPGHLNTWGPSACAGRSTRCCPAAAGSSSSPGRG